MWPESGQIFRSYTLIILERTKRPLECQNSRSTVSPKSSKRCPARRESSHAKTTCSLCSLKWPRTRPNQAHLQSYWAINFARAQARRPSLQSSRQLLFCQKKKRSLVGTPIIQSPTMRRKTSRLSKNSQSLDRTTRVSASQKKRRWIKKLMRALQGSR